MNWNPLLILFAVVALTLFKCSSAAEEAGIPLHALPVFQCGPYTVDPNAPAPTSVHKLAPHNIDVIMSMGDSITAAFGATAGKIGSLPLIPREDRYLSYNIGGGSAQYTVTNFLSVYNKNIQGGSSGTTLPLDALEVGGNHINPVNREVIGLNAALSGAKIQDIPQEIDLLVEQLKTTYRKTVDFQNSWKMATLLIGANNLCVICKNETANTPETFGQLLNSSIAHLQESIPRVRLNLLPIFNLTQVYFWSQTNQYCNRTWKLLDECPCLSSQSATPQDRHAVNVGAVQYRKVLEEVAEYWQGRSSDTFAVTVQPFSASLKIINGDLTSDFDCFHPSDLAHAWLGSCLWNSIWLPADKKPTNTTELMVNGLDFVCPGANTFMQ